MCTGGTYLPKKSVDVGGLHEVGPLASGMYKRYSQILEELLARRWHNFNIDICSCRFSRWAKSMYLPRYLPGDLPGGDKRVLIYLDISCLRN